MAEQCCDDVREILAAFLDDELPAEASHRVQEHLDACAGCTSYAGFEESFTSAIRTRLPRLQAPDSLLSRVRTQLDAEEVAPSPWFRGRLVGLATAAVIVLLLLPAGPLIRNAWQSWSGQAGDAAAGHHRSVAGVLVCFECEKEGVPIEMQRNCRAQGHQTGLRCPQTGLWHLVANQASSDLLADPGLRGRRVVLETETLDTIRYLDVRSVSFPSGT